MKFIVLLFGTLFLLPEISEQPKLGKDFEKSCTVTSPLESSNFSEKGAVNQISILELSKHFENALLRKIDGSNQLKIHSFTVAFEHKLENRVAVQQIEVGVHPNKIKHLATHLVVGTNLFIENIYCTNQQGKSSKLQHVQLLLIP